jgi:hypothetical protein
VKHCLGDHFSVSKVFNYNAFEKRRRDVRIPDSFGIDGHDGSRTAHAEARRFGPFDPGGAKEKALTLEQRREAGVQGAPAVVGRTETAGADQHVAGIGLHLGGKSHP